MICDERVAPGPAVGLVVLAVRALPLDTEEDPGASALRVEDLSHQTKDRRVDAVVDGATVVSVIPPGRMAPGTLDSLKAEE